MVLSDKGWLRAAKGHDIDPTSLNYKAGDKFLSSALGRSNQNVFLQDTTGRFYALPAHTLPSARGQGEPATGRLNPPAGSLFTHLVMGDDTEKYFWALMPAMALWQKLATYLLKIKLVKRLFQFPRGKNIRSEVSD